MSYCIFSVAHDLQSTTTQLGSRINDISVLKKMDMDYSPPPSCLFAFVNKPHSSSASILNPHIGIGVADTLLWYCYPIH
jgi:hypothetical protein